MPLTVIVGNVYKISNHQMSELYLLGCTCKNWLHQ
jgi:hypothetical protein